MKTSTLILEYIAKNSQASGKELTGYLGTISDRAVRKQLKSLLDKHQVRKIGKPPKVFYVLDQPIQDKNSILPDKQTLQIINDRYLYISPTGESSYGWEGFLHWCNKTNQNPLKTVKEYITTLKKYDQFKNDHLINGMQKLKTTFDTVGLDKLFYVDFYSIERFGKTKLGQMLLYAKQSQNKALIRKLVQEINPLIKQLILKFDIDGVLFIPPTVKRTVQFMKELEEILHLPVRKVQVTKIKTDIIVPQKTLSKLGDRIENARQTIIVTDNSNYRNVLIIDDAVGSGATLNETAKQLKNKHLVSGLIVGIAITGSYKGFDVISEV